MTGAYGLWHSIVAEEFIAREIHTGRSKYCYRPKWYHRTFHFVISFTFVIAALALLNQMWISK